MNNKDRKVFWDTLCSLKGVDIDQEAKILRSTIKAPKKLYRFRPVTINSLDSLRTNTMYFSTADHYDDPFDSFTHIDWDLVAKQIQAEYHDTLKLEIIAIYIQTTYNLPENTVKAMVPAIKSMTYKQWIDFSTTVLKEARAEIQKRQLSICFTEQCNNEVLWLKYASNHKGFALEYKVSDDSLLFNYNGIQHHHFLYPIYYSNIKYNASDYAKKIAFQLLALSMNPVLQTCILSNIPTLNWHYERIGLIKHKCHEHDKEWRILYPIIMPSHMIINQRPKMEWKPNSVIIGLRTETSEKNLIISLAKEAGIPRIYQLSIDRNGKFVKNLIYSDKMK